MADIAKYFADQLVNIAEIKEIIRVLNEEFEAVDKRIQQVLCNMFVLDCDEAGIERYEKMLGVTPEAGDTLDDRRFRILALYKGDTPYTLISLRQKLEDLCGAKNVEVTLDADNYRISIVIELASKNQYNTVLKVVKSMLPCNLELNCRLKYNRHETLQQFTHEQLAAYTHEQIVEEVLGG